MHLEPREYFTIARGLEDHADATTYYVRAVVRNARTDALIDTLDLVDNGSRRFTYPWQVPADPSGLGFYILVTTTVYTDSGYTTKAENYGEKFEEHLVQVRPTGGAGGGADVSYKKIREIVKDELDKLEFPEHKTDFSPLTDSLQAILSEVRSIDIPEAKDVSFTPLIAKFDALEASLIRAIEGKEVTPQTDLSDVLNAVSETKEALLSKGDESTSKLTDQLDQLEDELKLSVKQVTTEVIDKLDQQPVVTFKSPKIKEEVEEEIDYASLLS